LPLIILCCRAVALRVAACAMMLTFHADATRVPERGVVEMPRCLLCCHPRHMPLSRMSARRVDLPFCVRHAEH